jgi:hypothetical protein
MSLGVCYGRAYADASVTDCNEKYCRISWHARFDGHRGKGKLADLVLLDANPLDSIDNIRKVSAVVVNGHLLDRAVLDWPLAKVEAAANSM